MKILLLIIACLAHNLCVANSSYINDIPDFTQTDIVGSKSGHGQQYCAPVSVSNSLVWLSRNQIQQKALIHKLASKSYMNTSLKNGTGTSGVLVGVSKVSKEIFGGYRHLEYQGWRKHPSEYSNDTKHPQIEKIKSFVTKTSAAWVNIGWYKYDSKNNEYKRIGGHWVTVVGSTPNQLIIHDPSPRAGNSFSNEYVSYSEIKSGKLTGLKYGLPTSAKGYFKLGSGMHKKQRADFAIIDGVIFFSV
ncbi:MAG: hypothetical protein OCD00_13680 [Colwellia sp.]